jgi:MFS family permease
MAPRTDSRVRRGPIFYGWWIVAAGFCLEALIGGLMFHAYGAYLVVLREEFGWSKTLLSAAFSMARAESGILGPVQGWLTDRFGPAILIRAGMAIFGLGFILFSQIGSPTSFFLAFFMMALGSSLGGYLPIGVALVAWFRRRRALALSVSATGMSIGGLLTPVVVLALTRLGWRWTAFLSGVLILLVGVPVSRLVVHRPEALGLLPDGDSPAARGGEAGTLETTTGSHALLSQAAHPAIQPHAAIQVDFTGRQAMRTPAFWYIALGHASALLVVSAVVVHMVIHVTERVGLSLEQASGVVALMTVMQVIGQISGGWAGDRFSKRLICVGCMVGHAVALLLLASATSVWTVAAFAVLHGLSWGIRGPLMAAIRADYFGSGSFGMITGLSSMVVMLGMMGGPVIAGVLADRTGSYQIGFRVLAALAGLGSILFVLARRPRRPPAGHGPRGSTPGRATP